MLGYPQFKKLAGEMNKHVSVVHELKNIINDLQLLDISELEQVCPFKRLVLAIQN